MDIASISITANNCTLVQLNSTRFSVFPLHAIVDGLDVKTECLSALEPTNETVNEPINIAEFIDNLPVFSLVINNTNIQPWSDYQGSIWLRKNQVNSLQFDFRGDNLRLSSLITAEHQLVIKDFSAYLPEQKQTIELFGDVQLPLMANQFPEKGELNAYFKLINPEKFLL
ncbi:intermembrane phospholipid transport protein YdbH family protein, partial [Proteus terrae]|uniref:intermembrane phospholipid transport protein YdbH family protein n=1 Tax=Proteus terrae TaxID=1574161 RepID=UPI003F6F3676